MLYPRLAYNLGYSNIMSKAIRQTIYLQKVSSSKAGWSKSGNQFRKIIGNDSLYLVSHIPASLNFRLRHGRARKYLVSHSTERKTYINSKESYHLCNVSSIIRRITLEGGDMLIIPMPSAKQACLVNNEMKYTYFISQIRGDDNDEQEQNNRRKNYQYA